MNSKTIPDMKEVFRQAAEIAQQVPENMQVAAFNRALDLLTNSSESSKRRQEDSVVGYGSTKPVLIREPEKPATSIEALVSAIDTTQHPAVAATTKVMDRSLMVLQIALRNHGVDGLTPSEIAGILTDKFRLNTSRQAVNMAISSATTLVNRVRRGSGYEYRIMGPGEKYLAHIDSKKELADQDDSVRKAARIKRAGRKSTKQTGRAALAKTVGKSSRPGPKKILETLVDENFFNSPRNISQIIEHIRDQHARTYKATDLSPALTRMRREDTLSRKKSDTGVYEYVVRR